MLIARPTFAFLSTVKLSSLWQEMRGVIVDGLLILLPVTITGYVLWLGYSLIDGFFGRGTIIGNQLSKSLQRLFGVEWIPGLTIIYTAIVVILLGMVSKVYLGRLVRRFINWTLRSIPLVKKIYPPAQEVSEAILGRSAFSSFQQAVLIEYPRPDSYTVGFVTNRIKDNVLVYIFPAPNPFTGRILFLSEEEVTPLNITVEEGIKLIISMGISSPDSFSRNENINQKTQE